MWCKWRRRTGMYNRYARTRGCATINLISCPHNLRNIFSRSLSRLSIIIFAWRKKRKLKNFLSKALNVFRDIVTHNWMCAIEITLKLVNNFSIFVQIDLTKRACYKKLIAKALIDSINQFLKFSYTASMSIAMKTSKWNEKVGKC